MNLSVLFCKFDEYKTIIQNAGYLSIIEIIRLVLPFVALPYVIKTVGGDNYGIAVFSQTVVSYFMVLVNFGLDESAVKNVSINRDNGDRLNEIVTSVLLIKSVLLVVGFILLCLLLFTVPFMKNNRLIFIFAYITLISDIMYPVWFYQGIEKMKYITIVKGVSVLFYTATVFMFVRCRDDYGTVVLLQSLGNVFAGLISLYLLFAVNRIKLVRPTLVLIKKTFIDSIPFFFSRMSMVVNSGMAKLVSGFFLTMETVAMLDVAGKVCAAGMLPIQAVNQSLYPHIARMRNVDFVKKSLRYVVALSFVIAVGIVLLSPWGVPLLSGGELNGAVLLTQVLSVQVFLGGISVFLGAPVLVSFGYPNVFNRSVIFSTFVLLAAYSTFYAIGKMSVYMFAVIAIVVEIFVLLYRGFGCRKYKIL